MAVGRSTPTSLRHANHTAEAPLTSMNRDIHELLQSASSSAELVDRLRALCDQLGTVEGITVSCGGFLPHRLVCMIRMGSEEQASELSQRLGVVPGGTADVVFSYELPAHFACLGELKQSASSCLCFPRIDRTNTVS